MNSFQLGMNLFQIRMNSFQLGMNSFSDRYSYTDVQVDLKNKILLAGMALKIVQM